MQGSGRKAPGLGSTEATARVTGPAADVRTLVDVYFFHDVAAAESL